MSARQTTAQDSVIGSVLHDFCNILSTVDSESSKESDNDSVSDSSDSKYKCDSEIKDTHAYYLHHDFSAPAIDLPISREGATVKEQAIPSAEEFADALLCDLDLVNLRKCVQNQKFLTSKEIAGLGAIAKKLA